MTPRTILVVEDEYFLADDCASLMRKAGFDVAGPYGTVEEVPELPNISGALLDINVRGTSIFPLLDRLLATNIPVVLYTGYSDVPERYASVPRVIKPARCADAVKALRLQIGDLDD